MPKPVQYSDEILVDGCVKNDRFYQEILYRKYFDSMMRMCMRYTQDRDIAMEIINNGFLRVFKKIGLYSFTGSLEGWIRRLVFHSLSDYFKKKNKAVHFLSVEDWDSPVQQSALSNLYLEDLLQMVENLPDASRRVFHLYAIEGYTHVEIADMINISVGTSKWHLSTARKKLKKMINNLYNTNYHAG